MDMFILFERHRMKENFASNSVSQEKSTKDTFEKRCLLSLLFFVCSYCWHDTNEVDDCMIEVFFFLSMNDQFGYSL